MSSIFQFAFRCSDGSTKFLLLETESTAQAECVKEVMGHGLSEQCILLAVFTGCVSVMVANDAFSTVGFAEFMADVAGFDSMPEDLQLRIEAAAAPQTEELRKTLSATRQTDQLVSALTGLGFGAKNVKKWVQSLGQKAEVQDLPSLVKDGVKALVSAQAS